MYLYKNHHNGPLSSRDECTCQVVHLKPKRKEKRNSFRILLNSNERTHHLKHIAWYQLIHTPFIRLNNATESSDSFNVHLYRMQCRFALFQNGRLGSSKCQFMVGIDFWRLHSRLTDKRWSISASFFKSYRIIQTRSTRTQITYGRQPPIWSLWWSIFHFV